MSKTAVRLTVNVIPNNVRRDTLDGDTCLVVPATMLVEGVHNGSLGPLYYPAAENIKAPSLWDHKPIVVYHPEGADGKPVSACTPTVLNTRKVGVMLNTSGTADGKLKTECWFYENRLKSVDKRVFDAINNNAPTELSTGLGLDLEPVSGKWNDEPYTGIARNHVPDHLAILPDKVGACSLADGAGLLVNSAKEPESVQRVFGRSAVEALKPIGVSVVGNAMSFSDISRSVIDLLAAKFGEKGKYWDGWIAELFPDAVVFYNEDNKLYKISYTAGDTGVKLSGTAVQVRRTVEYVPVTTAANSERKKMAFDRKSHIDTLIANGFPEDQRDELNKLPDRLLELIKAGEKKADEPPPVVNVEKKDPPVPVTKEGPKPMTVDEYLNAAPVEVKAVIANALKAEAEQKSKLVKQVTNAKTNVFTEAWLAQRTVEELQNLVALTGAAAAPAPPVYFGAIGSPVANAEDKLPPPLLPPKLEFAAAK